MESGQVSAKPLTREESKILLSFIENSKIINNKATNATTNKMKMEEWKRIADQFNAVVTSCYRTPQQLRLKWENLKKKSRKHSTLIRMNNIKTGGGGPDYIPPDEILDRVAALLGNTVHGLLDEYGGDAQIEPEPKTASAITILDGGGIEIDIESDKTVNILNEVKETGDCTAQKQNKSFVFTPRASGFKRKLLSKNDENRAARDKAIADYYVTKKKFIEANLENVLLQNKKLKLEIENIEKNDRS